VFNVAHNRPHTLGWSFDFDIGSEIQHRCANSIIAPLAGWGMVVLAEKPLQDRGKDGDDRDYGEEERHQESFVLEGEVHFISLDG